LKAFFLVFLKTSVEFGLLGVGISDCPLIRQIVKEGRAAKRN